MCKFIATCDVVDFLGIFKDKREGLYVSDTGVGRGCKAFDRIGFTRFLQDSQDLFPRIL
jgi:hypothetical protein